MDNKISNDYSAGCFDVREGPKILRSQEVYTWKQTVTVFATVGFAFAYICVYKYICNNNYCYAK